jgi:hypothetical protein
VCHTPGIFLYVRETISPISINTVFHSQSILSHVKTTLPNITRHYLQCLRSYCHIQYPIKMCSISRDTVSQGQVLCPMSRKRLMCLMRKSTVSTIRQDALNKQIYTLCHFTGQWHFVADHYPTAIYLTSKNTSFAILQDSNLLALNLSSASQHPVKTEKGPDARTD